MNLSFNEMYEALGKKESIYEGSFYTAVKTTKIFCRPSCRARKPLEKNVTFYKSTDEALNNGYRPCKICRPMEREGQTPQEIQKIIKELHQKPFSKITDSDLAARKLEPSFIRRWFKKNHNMTFHNYQRLIRANHGFDKIKEGETITNTAFDMGYESLSGFNENFKSIFGDSPKNTKNKSIVKIDRISTKLGVMFIGATENGICLLKYDKRERIEAEIKDLKKRINAVFTPGLNKHSRLLKKELSLYFKGTLKTFSVSLDPVGTEFQKQVWHELIKVPYGETRSYKQQAEMIKNPKAVRAVAKANSMNKISIVIPCHRIIGSNGSLTGYAGGLPRKQWLLNHESTS